MMASCSAGVSDNDPPKQDQGAMVTEGSNARGAPLYPIRYGYRGGPYTRNGKPRPKSPMASENVLPAPM
jgi:hypothetical protein